MAIARYYKVGVFDTSTPLATGASVTSTTPAPILAGTTTPTNDINISAVRVSAIGSSSGFPSNASFVGSLNLFTGSPGGGQSASVVKLITGELASNTTWKTAGGTSAAAITGLTLSTFLWSQDIPFTAGANWGEWFTPGFEKNVTSSTGVALYITEQSAGTGTTFGGEIEYTE